LRTKDRPFEGVLGNTVELRILERLIASPSMEFNITELGTMAGVHRDSASKVVDKFARWNMLIHTVRRGNTGSFRLNTEEPLVRSINAFNDSLIMQLFPEVEETLEEMEFEPLAHPGQLSVESEPFMSTTVESAPFIRSTSTERTPRGFIPTKAW
jgi:hypothetical protein